VLIFLLIAAICAVAAMLVTICAGYASIQLRDLKKARKIDSWESISLPDQNYRRASKLIFHFHLARTLVFSSLVLILVGFGLIYYRGVEILLLDMNSSRLGPVHLIIGTGIMIAVLSIPNTIGYYKKLDRHIITGQ